MELSIVIPAHNEERRLPPTLESYLSFFMKEFQKPFEIIVVVNNSRDRTLEFVQEFSSRFPQVRYLDLGTRGGKGLALMEGFGIAQGKHIGFVDADSSTSPSAFYELYKSIGLHEGVIASRWIAGSVISPRQKISRRIASRGFNALVRILFDIQLHDTQCGAKLFNGSALKVVLPSLGITRWAFDIDLLYQFQRRGFSITEVPTIWSDTHGSRFRLSRDVKEMFLSIARLRLLYSPFSFFVSWYDYFINSFRGKK